MKSVLFAISLGFSALSAVRAAVPAWGQCGGNNYTGETTCVSGYTCVYSNEWYSQCVPSTNAPTSARATSSVRTSSVRTSSVRTTSTSRAVQPSGTTSPAGGVTGWAAAGGTTGGQGGPTTRVSTLAALKTAVSGNSAKIVVITASLSGNEVVSVGSNTSLYGASGSVTLTGIGIRVNKVSNVIIRNLKITKVLADAGDAIGVQEASKVFIDHVDLSSDRDHDKDYYDGLADITHGCTYVTLSNSYLHDHWKTVLIGHSDSNASEDTAMTVTVNNNYFKNVNSRGPSFRFGKGHIYNNYYQDMSDGINTRVGAVLRVENNVWTGTCSKALYSTDGGYAQASGNDFGTCESGNTAPSGSLSIPYSYSLLATSSVPSSVVANAGAKLSF